MIFRRRKPLIPGPRDEDLVTRLNVVSEGYIAATEELRRVIATRREAQERNN